MPPLIVSLANDTDREAIYAARHQVYAVELGQYPQQPSRRLVDTLDEINAYMVARRGGRLVGFISITPPNARGFSIDKYFVRDALPITFDDSLYEVRLLTVLGPNRRTPLAFLLMYAALRYLQGVGARTVVAIGRQEVLPMYTRCGLRPLSLRAKSGAVTYELMTAQVSALVRRLSAFTQTLRRLEPAVEWQLPPQSPRQPPACDHGGAFFEALGEEFDQLHRAEAIISADVLDAWFDPAPSVLSVLTQHLPFAIRTSPPALCAGMQRVIARRRRVPEESVLPGAGSSDLIFAGLRHWIQPESRVLILDPMYGEYSHVLDQLIGAQVRRLRLQRDNHYDVDPAALAAAVNAGCDWVILVNPNSPTGRHMPHGSLSRLIAAAPSHVRWWIDETYIEFVNEFASLETMAAQSSNVIVCKSMSKVYALSGARAAYLVGPPALLDELRPFVPPWAVSLVGQMAACEALAATAYYRARWAETTMLRESLAASLRGLDWDVVPGCANFLLCHLPASAPTTADLLPVLRTQGLFLRDVSNMGTSFDNRTLRVAVKKAATNQRICDLISGACGRVSEAQLTPGLR